MLCFQSAFHYIPECIEPRRQLQNNSTFRKTQAEKFNLFFKRCLTFYYKSVIHMARVDRRNLPENGTPENVSSAFGGAFILPILQGKGSKSTHCPTPDNEKKSRRDADPLQCPNDMLYFSLLESGGKFHPLWIL